MTKKRGRTAGRKPRSDAQKNRGRILAFVKEDPALTKELGEQVVREMVKDKPAVEQALRAAKVINDNPVPPPPK